MAPSAINAALNWTTITVNAVSAGVGQHLCVIRANGLGAICRGSNTLYELFNVSLPRPH
jgi:hypothetical protein